VRSGVFAAVALEPCVIFEVAVERSLELVHAVASGEPQKNLATLGGDSWIPGAASPTALLEKVLANAAHALHSAVTKARLVGRISHSIKYLCADYHTDLVVERSTTGRYRPVNPDNHTDADPMKSTPRYQPNALPYLAKVRVAVSNTVVRSNRTPETGPFRGPCPASESRLLDGVQESPAPLRMVTEPSFHDGS